MFVCSYLIEDKEGAGAALRAATRALPAPPQLQRIRSYADSRCCFAKEPLNLCNRKQRPPQRPRRTKEATFYQAIYSCRANIEGVRCFYASKREFRSFKQNTFFIHAPMLAQMSSPKNRQRRLAYV